MIQHQWHVVHVQISKRLQLFIILIYSICYHLCFSHSIQSCRNRIQCPCWLKTFEQAKLNNNAQIQSWQRQNLTIQQMISRFAYIHQRLKTPVWSGIYECNSKCSCHIKQCTNRLVQNSLYQQIQLFRTNSKGWGLRVLHDIPHGR